jgi:hypothetical protein
MKLKYNNKRNRKYSNIRRLNNTLLHDQCVIKEVSSWKLIKMKHNLSEPMEYSNIKSKIYNPKQAEEK